MKERFRVDVETYSGEIISSTNFGNFEEAEKVYNKKKKLADNESFIITFSKIIAVKTRATEQKYKP